MGIGCRAWGLGFGAGGLGFGVRGLGSGVNRVYEGSVLGGNVEELPYPRLTGCD